MKSSIEYENRNSAINAIPGTRTTTKIMTTITPISKTASFHANCLSSKTPFSFPSALSFKNIETTVIMNNAKGIETSNTIRPRMNKPTFKP